MKFFVILTLILFIPIPLKLNFYASKNNFVLKLYGFTIISKEKLEMHELRKKAVKTAQNKKVRQSASKIKKKINFKDINFKKIITNLYYSHFKPILRLKMKFTFSFDDAAKTAMAYGMLCPIPEVLYMILKIIFKPSKYNFKLKPVFKDKVILKFQADSIIFLSFGNIINMLIIVLNSNKK